MNPKGYDIKGDLLCEDCWNKLDDVERDVMYEVKSKEDYLLNKTELIKRYNSKGGKKNLKAETIKKTDYIPSKNPYVQGIKMGIGMFVLLPLIILAILVLGFIIYWLTR